MCVCFLCLLFDRMIFEYESSTRMGLNARGFENEGESDG